MNGKRGWKTRARSTWLVAWMALITIGVALSPPPTAAADLAGASPAAAEDAQIPRDAPARVCSIFPAAGQNSGTSSETRLAGPEGTDAARDAATAAPADGTEDEFIHWEVHQKATGTTEYRGP